MIVKNEEALLPQCLQSIEKYVDEIIVVDTGSTDETVSIAKSFGAKVFHHPWEDDFGKHRNQSLAYASGDWILILDADEELLTGSGPTLRKTVQNATADYFFCPLYDIDRHGEVTAAYNSVRLFRNHMGMSYTRRIHNQLGVKGKKGYSEIRFNHYGYDLSPKKMKAKHQRTTSLLLKTIEKDPEDIYSLHQLAGSYLNNQEYSKTVEYGEKALHIRRKKRHHNTFFINTYYLVATAYYNLQNVASASRIAHEARDVFGDHLDTCYILTAVYFKQKSFDRCKKMALRYLELYTQLEENPSIIGNGLCFTFDPSKRSTILTYLAYTFFIDKDLETTEFYFQQAFDTVKNQMQVAENTYRFYLKQHMGKQALQWLVAAYEAGCSRNESPKIIRQHPGFYLKIAEYYLQHDNPEAANQSLALVQDSQLSADEQVEKYLHQINVYWAQEAVEDVVKTLESLMLLLHMDTNRCLNSFDDLGSLFYETAEVLSEQQKWRLAEPTLKLAIQMAPNCFQPERFQSLLASATQ